MNLAFFMNLRDLDASEIGESRHTRHMEWASCLRNYILVLLLIISVLNILDLFTRGSDYHCD